MIADSTEKLVINALDKQVRINTCEMCLPKVLKRRNSATAESQSLSCKSWSRIQMPSDSFVLSSYSQLCCWRLTAMLSVTPSIT